MKTPTSKPNFKKKAIPHGIRKQLAFRAGFKLGQTMDYNCEKCGAPGKIVGFTRKNGKPSQWFYFSGLEMDHIHPESNGGKTKLSNMQLLCRKCNRTKGDRVE